MFFDLVILFFNQFNDIFKSTKMKARRDSQSVFTSMVDAFASCKDVENAVG